MEMSDEKQMTSRKGVLLAALIAVVGIAGFSWWTWQESAPAKLVEVEGAARKLIVYKSPSCGCCGNWVEHMKQAGFKVQVHNTDDMDRVKSQVGLPYEMASCHTALIDGYVIEGHVPADDVKRLLAEKHKVKGIAAPGMPIGSPGMEQGDEKEAYQVVAFGDQGFKVFAEH